MKRTEPSPKPADPREQLEESMEDATAEQPETFRDEANEDKVVEIPPDKTRDPIHGIDPPEGPGR